MNTIHMSHIARLKWRHWLLITLLAIVTVVRSSHSLGLAYTTKIYPVCYRPFPAPCLLP